MARERIACVGAGRMGRGMAIAFAYSGHQVALIDLKPRTPAEFDTLKAEATTELEATLTLLSGLGLLEQHEVAPTLARVGITDKDRLAESLQSADVVFEGVPETLEAKESAFALISEQAKPDAIVASTTSTILSNDLAPFVKGSHRFLNAHWLNPAYLVPLVELSPAAETDPDVTKRLSHLLERIGKVPVTCSASPGYIVPRIQALAMNEAARLVEEGVATADDIDKATKYGFGFRFAVLGLLEFVDWGGGDILYYASRYMAAATGEDRFKAPQIIEDNMHAERRGLRDGAGFLDYEGRDMEAYQRGRLEAFADMLRHLGKMPVKANRSET